MFENIGKKIKILATIISIIGFVVFSIIGLIFLFNIGFLAFLITISVGFLGSWLGSFFLYGFGELIETNSQICKTNIEIKSILANPYTHNSNHVKESTPVPNFTLNANAEHTTTSQADSTVPNDVVAKSLTANYITKKSLIDKPISEKQKEKINNLKILYEGGLITEEEYIDKIKKIINQ